MYSLFTFYFTSAVTETLLIQENLPSDLISKLYSLICVALILKTNSRKLFELDFIHVIQIIVYHMHSRYMGA